MSLQRDIVGGYESRKLRHKDLDMSGRSILGSQGQINTSTPCAACKLLRRRCAQECPFSPYFSPHEPQKFASVHKVFGASNVSKMLMEVPESQRADTASSLVYEANARLRDPVYGCMGAIFALQQQAQSLQAELNAVRAELMRYRLHEMATVGSASAPSLHIASFSNTRSDRTTSTISTQTTASTEYGVGSPTNTIASADTKDRYWSMLNQSC